MHILDTENPGLTSRLKLLNPSQRARVVGIAGLDAVTSIGGVEAHVNEWLQRLSRGDLLSSADVETARKLSALADEQYFSLENSGAPQADWIGWFSKARLLAAIGECQEPLEWENAANAVYELSKATDNPTLLFETVRLGA